MSYHDSDRLARVNTAYLFERGRQSYSFGDLAYVDTGTPKNSRELNRMSGSEVPTDSLIGTYQNNLFGEVIIEQHGLGLKVSYANGAEDVYTPRGNGLYAWADGDEAATFEREAGSGTWLLHLYVDGWWAATAHRMPMSQRTGK